MVIGPYTKLLSDPPVTVAVLLRVKRFVEDVVIIPKIKLRGAPFNKIGALKLRPAALFMVSPPLNVRPVL